MFVAVPARAGRSFLGMSIALFLIGSTPQLAAQGASHDLVRNGSFESGKAYWQGTTSVIGKWSSKRQPAYEGAKAARLGAKGSTKGRRSKKYLKTQTLFQGLTLPGGTAEATLSFWMKTSTRETGPTPYDTLSVRICNRFGVPLKSLATYSNLNASSVYQRQTFDLTAFAGQTIRIQFEAREDKKYATTFMLDKVVLTAIERPAVPSGLAAKATGLHAIDVTWPAVPGANSYEVQADGVTSTVAAPPFHHGNLDEGTTHTYLVRALNGAIASAWSSPVSATTLRPGDLKTVYTTCVKDNLDPSDRADFERVMVALGYTVAGSDKNITAAGLKDLLGRSDITMLYHTGHGTGGGMATATQILYIQDIPAVNVGHYIAATCLTMSDRTWATKMGPTCMTTNGYTNFSYDRPLDNDVAKKFGEALAAGHSYPKAWYLCNVWSSNLSDRWCTYAREASGIVEYSAVTGKVPLRQRSVPASATSERVHMAEDLRQREVPAEAFARADHQTFTAPASFRARDPKDFLPEGQDFSRFVSLPDTTESQARLAADQWIQDHGLTQETCLDKLIPVQTTREGQTRTVGYLGRYVRTFGGLALRANGIDDHVVLHLRGTQVLGFSENWTPATRTVDTAPLRDLAILKPAEALAIAAPDIAQRIKGEITIVEIEPCLGRLQGQTVPAYRLIDPTGASIIIHAATGHIL